MATTTAPNRSRPATKSARSANSRHTATGTGMSGCKITAEGGRIFMRMGGTLTWDLWGEGLPATWPRP